MRKQTSSLTVVQIGALKQRYESLSVQQLTTAVASLEQRVQQVKQAISQYESRKATMKSQSRQLTPVERGQQSKFFLGEEKRLGTMLADAEKELGISQASHRRLATRLRKEQARAAGFRR